MIEKIINKYADKIVDILVKNYQLCKSNRNSNDLEFLKRGIKSYLQKCRTNYYVKSLLYKEKGEYIDDIYVDIQLIDSRNRKISRKSIVEGIIAKYIIKNENGNGNNINHSSYILISGIGGCGKSVLMKKLFLDFLDSGTRRVFLPILIRLKSLSGERLEEFEDYIKNYFYNINIDFDSYLMECLLKSGNILLLLDGLDELSFEEKEIFLASLDTFKKRYDMISIIISARPEVRANSFPDFEQYEMAIMDKNKVHEYIDKLPDSFEKKVEVKERILDSVYYDKHRDLVGYPLMLAILLLTFDYNGELPVNRRSFFSKVFNTMWITHDREKEVTVKRKVKSGLTQEEFEQLWKVFCFITYMNNHISFEEDTITKCADVAIEAFRNITQKEYPLLTRNGFLSDVINILCFLIEEGVYYDFIHRSFQEYYAAEFILSRNDKFQKEIFLNDNNIFYNDRFELLNYLRMIDESKYKHICIAPVVEKFIELSKTYSDIKDFAMKQVDVIDWEINTDNPYIIYKEIKFSIIRQEVEKLSSENVNYSEDAKVYFKKNYLDTVSIENILRNNDNKAKKFLVKMVKYEVEFLENWYKQYRDNENKTNQIITQYLSYR